MQIQKRECYFSFPNNIEHLILLYWYSLPARCKVLIAAGALKAYVLPLLQNPDLQLFPLQSEKKIKLVCSYFYS